MSMTVKLDESKEEERRQMIDGRKSVCIGHAPDCGCTACAHVRHLLALSECDCIVKYGWDGQSEGTVVFNPKAVDHGDVRVDDVAAGAQEVE